MSGLGLRLQGSCKGSGFRVEVSGFGVFLDVATLGVWRLDKTNRNLHIPGPKTSSVKNGTSR